MADKNYADIMHDAAIAIQGFLRGMAFSRVREIANTCSIFKIGKTGETIEERKNQSDYRDKYEHIKEVYSSTDPHLVDNVEAELIRE
ncbi:MAG: hypothetical protein II551_02280, partial [Paludibacteraceae bacterium]|nr:hypothetical protein [Paludibacteraceae bacterium]